MFNKEFNIINKQENTNKEILKIKLKAKDNAVAGNTEIAIDEIVASNGTSEFESAKLNQNIDIKSKSGYKATLVPNIITSGQKYLSYDTQNLITSNTQISVNPAFFRSFNKVAVS